MTMKISVDIQHQRGDFNLHCKFECSAGLIALFGPSGAGKTTVIDAIAGLFEPDHARISIDDNWLCDTDAHQHVPAHERKVGYVFQEARLFPHLSVLRNLRYSRLITLKKSNAQSDETFRNLVDLLGLNNLLDRYPAELSGGEQQRVSIGRALLSNPAVLLLDEPLSQLDSRRKSEILPYLERLRDEVRTPMIYVSHSLDEVVRLADHMVCLDQGNSVASGKTEEVLTDPDSPLFRSRQDAGAVIRASVVEHDSRTGLSHVNCNAGAIRLPLLSASVGTRMKIWIRAQDVMLALDRPSGISALNHFRGVIESIGRTENGAVMVRINCGGDRLLSRITAFSVSNLALRPGLEVHAIVKSASFAIPERA